MHLIGHGIDIVSVRRIERLLEDHPERFRARIYTQAELDYAAGKKAQPLHLSARFAAKEAVMKVLGHGFGTGVAFTDIEVIREPTGKPQILCHNHARTLADRMRIERWHLSLSHTDEHAIASVIACAGGEGD